MGHCGYVSCGLLVVMITMAILGSSGDTWLHFSLIQHKAVHQAVGPYHAHSWRYAPEANIRGHFASAAQPIAYPNSLSEFAKDAHTASPQAPWYLLWLGMCIGLIAPMLGFQKGTRYVYAMFSVTGQQDQTEGSHLVTEEPAQDSLTGNSLPGMEDQVTSIAGLDAVVDEDVPYWQAVGSMLQASWPLILGNTLEWYEFSAYGYLIPELQVNFFQGSAIFAWLGFALTFIMRPLGGLLLGWTADRYGRKTGVVVSLAGMLTATVMQGCLPSELSAPDSIWPQVGLVLMVICRMSQGLFTGGEISGVSVSLGEHDTKKCLGMATAMISFGGSFAFFLSSSIVGSLHAILTEEEMLLWGWRIPFLITLIPGLISLVTRVNMPETKAFEEIANSQESEAGNVEHFQETVGTVLSEYKAASLISVLGTAAIATLWYIGPIYTCDFLTKYTGLPATTSLAIGSTAQLVAVSLAPVMGLLTDRIGAGKVMLLGSTFIAISGLPVYLVLTQNGVDPAVIGTTVVGVFGLAQALGGTTVYLWALELFDTAVRTTGMGMTYNFAVSYFGGCAPVLADFFAERGDLLAPGIMISAAGVISTITLLISRKLNKDGKIRLTHIRDSPY